MRILLVGGFNWFEGIALNCENALKKLGHEVCRFEYATLSNYSPRFSFGITSNSMIRDFSVVQMNEGFFSKVEAVKSDLILIIKGETILPEVLLNIKKELNIPIATWWMDDPLFEWHEDLPVARENISNSLKLFDHFFVFDSYHIPRLKRLGIRSVHWLPLAVDPNDYYPLALSDTELSYYGSDVSFAGSAYRSRGRVLIELMDFNLKLWGGNWLNEGLKKVTTKRGEIISTEEACKIYNATKINLSLCHQQSVFGPNLRVFEILAPGGFLITENLADLHKLFKVGEEIVCYDGVEDLKDKIKYYLAHPEERKAIAEAGHRRVIENHTYLHRMKELLNIVSEEDKDGMNHRNTEENCLTK